MHIKLQFQFNYYQTVYNNYKIFRINIKLFEKLTIYIYINLFSLKFHFLLRKIHAHVQVCANKFSPSNTLLRWKSFNPILYMYVHVKVMLFPYQLVD